MRKGLIGLAAIGLCGVLAMEPADAARLGGARSTGVQRSVPKTPPSATPAKPAQQQAAPNQAAPAAQPQPSGLARWMPMLGGLALGGLLGYLFAGNGMGGILLLALLAVGGVLLFRMFARRGAQSPQPIQYAGMNQGTTMAQPPAEAPGAAMPPAARFPGGFDAASFLRGAKMNFAKLQLANDQGKLDDIREFTTDEMFEALERDVLERRGAGQQTDIEALDAQVVDFATEGERHWVSVRFSGQVREAVGAAPVDFAEVWNLVKPADGSSGWLLAGIQQMH
ncbi:MAG TPA: Tim44-like domain-containing protein [Burkholderiales bacterium]|jgi:predicted lipid-binding transport protein (Tim44 family)|nr:Tim44-like domain-containing protein [Burkholderiales bacterium]